MARNRILLPAAICCMLVLGSCGSKDTWSKADLPHDAPSGGQIRTELESELRDLPGVEDLTIGGWKPNSKGSVGVSFEFYLASDHEIADGASLVTYLVEAAWSVRDGYQPNASISITVHSDPDDPFDGPAAARDAGWSPSDTDIGRFNARTGYSVTEVWLPGYDRIRAHSGLGAQENEERLGSWPGKVPTVPEDAIVPRT